MDYYLTINIGICMVPSLQATAAGCQWWWWWWSATRHSESHRGGLEKMGQMGTYGISS